MVENDLEMHGSAERKPSDQSQTVVDPSDAVTGLSFIFGAIGAVVGVAAALVFSPSWTPRVIVYCVLAAFSGASAGIVTGGMLGAIFAIWRGVTTPSRQEKEFRPTNRQ